MATDAYVYDRDYREDVTLTDGTEVMLRLIRPSDKRSLELGLEHLSPISRYRRFFTAKERFSSAELRYLTELDEMNHLAIVAVRGISASSAHLDAAGMEEGVGAARFVRLSQEPDTAEAAIAIVDALQGKGLGTILLRRLAEAAFERDVRAFRCDFLADNQAIVGLLRTLSPELHLTELDGGVCQARVDLWPPGEETDARKHAMHRFMAHAAKGSLDVDH